MTGARRIVFICQAAALGGAERSLLDLLASMRAHRPGDDLRLIAAEQGPLLAAARDLGVAGLVIPMGARAAGMGDSGLTLSGSAAAYAGLAAKSLPAAWAAWRWSRRLGAALAQMAPHVVHTNSLKSHVLAVAGRPRAPVVWHLRDFLSSRSLLRRVLPRLARRAAGAIAISHAVAADARRILGPLPVEVVHNAIDTGVFAPGPADPGLLDRLSKPPSGSGTRLRVGLVASYARWKGHDVFLEAAARLRDRRPGSCLFYIVGGPIYRTAGSQFSEQELVALSERLSLGESVRFIPFQADPAPVYRALDVVVHASTRPEPFGRTIVEAMACGRPVVASKGGGAAELFREGEEALGVPPGDAEALSRAVERLLADRGLRERMAEAARKGACDRFSRGRLAGEVDAAYRRFLGRGDAVGGSADTRQGHED
ncbi:MAG TPA: glycosyltransferase family 4 protein [Candidatus Polarisedimenticolia bacterium]|nr:glycosyltransferase family 4 protein [Candidatus Polarisedimenticolia bacterium]